MGEVFFTVSVAYLLLYSEEGCNVLCPLDRFSGQRN